MNTVPRPPEAAAPAAQTPAQTPARQTLADALGAVFAPGSSPPFAQRLVGFTEALIPEARAWVVMPAPDGATRTIPTDGLSETGVALACACLDPEADAIRADPRFLSARICLDTGKEAALVVEVRSGGQTARALAHERLSLLSRLSFATYKPETVDLLQRLLALFAAFGKVRGDAAPETDLQAMADLLARFLSADYAAVARYDGTHLRDLHISGQADTGKAAALPAQLSSAMAETARLRLCTTTRAFTGDAGRSDGLVFHVEAPRRNASLLPFLAASAGRLAPQAARPGVQWKRWARRGAIALGLGALTLVPIPDGVSLPAEVAAVSQRIITSPLDATLSTMEVRAGDSVVAGETVLARFDTRALDLELIAARASYSRALLDRERARAGRLAADLRTAELEAERVLAEIDLLEARKETAVLIAPISGLVIGEGLADLTGALLRQGDRVLDIADPSALELDVSVPQSQVAKVSVGAIGAFRPDFDPSLRFETEVTALSPAAPSSERLPLYPAQAKLAGEVARLRPGMTGVVALDRSWRPIWQVAGQALRDWVLLRLWI